MCRTKIEISGNEILRIQSVNVHRVTADDALGSMRAARENRVNIYFRVHIQKKKSSMREMRSKLWKVQSRYLKDSKTSKAYRLPSAMSIKAKKIISSDG